MINNFSLFVLFIFSFSVFGGTGDTPISSTRKRSHDHKASDENDSSIEKKLKSAPQTPFESIISNSSGITGNIKQIGLDKSPSDEQSNNQPPATAKLYNNQELPHSPYRFAPETAVDETERLTYNSSSSSPFAHDRASSKSSLLTQKPKNAGSKKPNILAYDGSRWVNELHINMSDDLLEMRDAEKYLSAIVCNGKNKTTNLALVKIGAYYTDAYGTKKYASIWVKIPTNTSLNSSSSSNSNQSSPSDFDFGDNAEDSDKLNKTDEPKKKDVFSSGYIDALSDARLKEYFFLNPINSLNQEYQIAQNLLQIYEEEAKRSIKTIDTGTTTNIHKELRNYIDNKSNPPQMLLHSEQVVIYYLSNIEVIQENIKNLKNKIANLGNINKIVLLIHTRQDACETCTPSISIFKHRFAENVKKNFENTSPEVDVVVSSRQKYGKRRDAMNNYVSHIVLPDEEETSSSTKQD